MLLARTWVAILFLASLCGRVDADFARTPDVEHAQIIEFLQPLPGTVFPPEMPPPRFAWSDTTNRANQWRILCYLRGRSVCITAIVDRAEWTPDPATWATIKQASLSSPATIELAGYSRVSPGQVSSKGLLEFSTSSDPVNAALFYREVNLPFSEAVKDPTQIRWRFGTITNRQPPRIVLEHLPVCGNCHSFSRDGSVLGLDVDYANSKGSYALTETRPYLSLRSTNIITWDDYRREDGELTFGLLSQVSPDGRRVVSTVKDKSVFVPRTDLAFSQLFFPIKGILVVYDREARNFQPLPGADDPVFVQSNPVWSPDGSEIVFARSPAYDLKNTAGQGKVLLTPEECREFTQDGKPFRYDLYRVRYNEGKGGQPEPVLGASNNEFSNFFPRFSPDGKWIVFCRAANYMLLQPDSQLYIIPAKGGEARRLRANTKRMNSWHSWTPNSRWLVFSSKANSAYTQLFLTHIDEQGESSPSVVLEYMTAPDRAANIPEFVDLPPERLMKIDAAFLDDYSFERAANEFYRGGDPEQAMANYRKALELNPNNSRAHQRLGFLVYHVKHQFAEGIQHTTEALRLDPGNSMAHSDLSVALLNQGRFEAALPHLEAALATTSLNPEPQYQAETIRTTLGQTLLKLGQYPAAVAQLQLVVDSKPDRPEARYVLALGLVLQGRLEDGLRHYRQAVKATPSVDTSVTLHDLLAAQLAKVRRYPEAIQHARRALELAETAGKSDLVAMLRARVESYERANHPGK